MSIYPVAKRWHWRDRTYVGVHFLALSLVVAMLPGCDSDDELQRALRGEAATSGTVLSALSRASTTTGVMGTLTAGSQASGSNAALTLTLSPSAPAVTNGGTATLAVASATAFSELTVAVAGLEGCYSIALPMAVTSSTLQLTIDQDIMTPTVTFSVVAREKLTTAVPLCVYRSSGSWPRLPIRITLFIPYLATFASNFCD